MKQKCYFCKEKIEGTIAYYSGIKCCTTCWYNVKKNKGIFIKPYVYGEEYTPEYQKHKKNSATALKKQINKEIQSLNILIGICQTKIYKYSKMKKILKQKLNSSLKTENE